MDKYEVIHLLGEGSFGRVYKAKQSTSNTIVALKVICKRGRCAKELKGLRRECEIQRHLHHPNIIQLLDSFETENEIVVITEFAHKELNVLLAKKGVLPEDIVQKITWDLVSALYYLHSHRVLHRDLKPQNVLLDEKNHAKLCDFGFARSLSTETHFLTSIKGTPLYMAPELVDELPYDHNADLWSLGCIIYELLEGAPPFRTTSILHLIDLIRNEQVVWPTKVSDNCSSFLKGLLQKNPKNRMTWPEILNHPFIKGHVKIVKDTPEMTLTRPLSPDVQESQKEQKLAQVHKSTQSERNKSENESEMQKIERNFSKLSSSKQAVDRECSSNTSAELVRADSQDLKNNNPPESKRKNVSSGSKISADNKFDSNIDARLQNGIRQDVNITSEKSFDTDQTSEDVDICEGKVIEFIEHTYKIENEEWLAFLKKTIGELKTGGLSTFAQTSVLNIVMSPLINSTASSEVVSLAAKLFCLPFVIGRSDVDGINLLKKLYFEVRLVPNLVYAMYMLFRTRKNENKVTDTNKSGYEIKNMIDLTASDLECLEYICLAISHFIHWSDSYVEQFCDAITTLEMYPAFKLLLFCTKRRLRIVIDVIACLTQILRTLPRRRYIVDKILESDSANQGVKYINLNELLRHVNPLLRERTCYFLLFLGAVSPSTLAAMWSDSTKEILEALMYDSIDTVRIAAERAYEVLADKPFYLKGQ